MFNAQCSMFNCAAVARTCICCRRSRCKSCKQVRARSGNAQCSMLNAQCSMFNCAAVARTYICCRRSRCKSCKQVRERSGNVQCSMFNAQCSTFYRQRIRLDILLHKVLPHSLLRQVGGCGGKLLPVGLRQAGHAGDRGGYLAHTLVVVVVVA